MSDYTSTTQESTNSSTQNDEAVSTAVTRDRRTLPGVHGEQGLTERTTSNVSNTPTKSDNGKDHSRICSWVGLLNLTGYSWPRSRVASSK